MTWQQLLLTQGPPVVVAAVAVVVVAAVVVVVVVQGRVQLRQVLASRLWVIQLVLVQRMTQAAVAMMGAKRGIRRRVTIWKGS
jgi:hypothetical protein